MTFVNVIRNKAAFFLVCATIFMIVCAVSMIDSGRCLKTRNASLGIVSFELAWSNERAKQIRSEWESGYCNGDVISFNSQHNAEPGSLIIEKAKQNILLDYLFLFAYPFFFAVSIILLDRPNQVNLSSMAKTMLTLAIAAGLLDSIENIFMYLYLTRSTESSFLFALPATVKFALVVVVIFYLILVFASSLGLVKRRLQ